MYTRLITAFICGYLSFQKVQAQEQPYVYPKDSLVAAKLEQWRDLKFGIIIHWGLYAQAGIMESWTLCAEDWIDRDTTRSYEDYKNWYWSMANVFNPVRFDPDAWATTAANAGMRYLVFTTKHHDGFAMFNTRQSNFNIAQGPFKQHPKADVTRYVFDAFRKKGLMIGAYFSKPDWHCTDYWWPVYPTADRNVNYDIRKFPNRWNNYKKFTHRQVEELMTGYGKVDILWLDGGWVRPLETVNDEVRSWGCRIPQWSQDIDIPAMATMARKHQPGLLVVDRTVHGEYENYRTPEQRIPQQALNYPWESCITLADNWGYVPGDRYKPAARIIQTLIEVTAKGGNLLLGIGPKPDGTLDDSSTLRLKEIGAWLQVHGEAIYQTRPVTHYHQPHTWFTQHKQNGKRYAIVTTDTAVGNTIEWQYNLPKKGSRMVLLHTHTAVPWEIQGNTVRVTLPPGIAKGLPAFVLSYEPASATE